jgi:KipI family sensor histidine kinase inhibitor
LKEPQPLGDSALLFAFDEEDEPYAVAQNVAERLAAESPRGLRDVAAAYAKVAVYFEPLVIEPAAIVTAVRTAVRTRGTTAEEDNPPFAIQVEYDGPDLDYVASAAGLAREDVVRLHSEREYRAYAVGFVPGFAYLGDLDERLRLPRRDSPRTHVPAGSVAIAGAHTAVYPLTTPGGWHLIGRTQARMFDAERNPPSLLRVGSRVRFVAA